jgi:hypothetical protein
LVSQAPWYFFFSFCFLSQFVLFVSVPTSVHAFHTIAHAFGPSQPSHDHFRSPTHPLPHPFSPTLAPARPFWTPREPVSAPSLICTADRSLTLPRVRFGLLSSPFPAPRLFPLPGSPLHPLPPLPHLDRPRNSFRQPLSFSTHPPLSLDRGAFIWTNRALVATATHRCHLCPPVSAVPTHFDPQ